MNFEKYNKKVIDLINLPEKIDTKVENLTTVTKPTEALISIIPVEPNFLLPNIFLRTKKVPECERFIKRYATTDENTNELNKVLEEFEFEKDELTDVNRPATCNDQVLMEAIIKRY